MKISLIRHGATEGNLRKNYIGQTDEYLCEQGKAEIAEKVSADTYLVADKVFVSPLLRCLETANTIYPELENIIVEEIRECNFGDFENKNFEDLSGDPAYQEWIDSKGKLPFPNGESLEEFQKRCVYAFSEIVDNALAEGFEHVAIVAHGGTIMSIMSGFTDGEYFSFMAKNGGGYLLELDQTMWQAKLFKTLNQF